MVEIQDNGAFAFGFATVTRGGEVQKRFWVRATSWVERGNLQTKRFVRGGVYDEPLARGDVPQGNVAEVPVESGCYFQIRPENDEGVGRDEVVQRYCNVGHCVVHVDAPRRVAANERQRKRFRDPLHDVSDVGLGTERSHRRLGVWKYRPHSFQVVGNTQQRTDSQIPAQRSVHSFYEIGAELAGSAAVQRREQVQQRQSWKSFELYEPRYEIGGVQKRPHVSVQCRVKQRREIRGYVYE